MLQKKTKIVRQKATRRALISFRHYCPRDFMLGRETKPDISCEWNTKFSIIPEIPTNRVHSKRIPKFSKTFPGIFTVPFNFEPEISEFLVEWKAPLISLYDNFAWGKALEVSIPLKYESSEKRLLSQISFFFWKTPAMFVFFREPMVSLFPMCSHLARDR